MESKEIKGLAIMGAIVVVGTLVGLFIYNKMSKKKEDNTTLAVEQVGEITTDAE